VDRRWTEETTELLQQLIRNRCVNDGSATSGQEVRSADLLAAYLGTGGFDLQRFEPEPRRVSLLARMEGSDPGAPSLLLMGHTDVVPANASTWREDPFGGELIDGEVWGRGAVDMLNLTSSMAVAFRRLGTEGFRPRGTVSYLAVADEEAQGTYGAGWLTEREWDAVRADYVITEFGGYPVPLPSSTGPKYTVSVGERGSYWCRLRIRGRAGHGSMPFRTDNALVTAAEVVRRLARFQPGAEIHDVWRRLVLASDLPPNLARELLEPDGVDRFLTASEDPGTARFLHAATHMTVAPTMAVAGTKTNVIPDEAEVQLDIRTLPGQSGDDVRAMLREALGELFERVEIEAQTDEAPTISPMDTPLWDALDRTTAGLVDRGTLVPMLLVAATDARFYRRLGSVAYGFGLYGSRMSPGRFLSMFHGDDERVDQESLGLCAELWYRVARDLMG
jgi:acetylornithine deacetylase/succinyl-diaminopimelate desuccinylase-like protein